MGRNNSRALGQKRRLPFNGAFTGGSRDLIMSLRLIRRQPSDERRSVGPGRQAGHESLDFPLGTA